MGKSRIEAFSDGVLAIIITIMVLELEVPHAATLVPFVTAWRAMNEARAGHHRTGGLARAHGKGDVAGPG